MKFTVITLFPKLIESFIQEGLLGQAVTQQRVGIATLNPRQFTTDVHHTVDDKAFGGGDGMVMKFEPLKASIDQVRAKGPARVVLLTPQGRRWSQALAREFAKEERAIALICGRYAGTDSRLSQFVDDEISIGDFILNGGELAALTIIESSARLKPGVLGNAASAAYDSFSGNLLESPQFTRPREVEGMTVPSPLLSGHHEKIRAFERAVSVIKTALLRPDLGAHPTALDLAQVEVLDDSELKALAITREQLQNLKPS